MSCTFDFLRSHKLKEKKDSYSRGGYPRGVTCQPKGFHLLLKSKLLTNKLLRINKAIKHDIK